jgi:hypothetical protein
MSALVMKRQISNYPGLIATPVSVEVTEDETNASTFYALQRL